MAEIPNIVVSKFKEGFPPIICLCGSSRFVKAYEDAEFTLTLQRVIVLSVCCRGCDGVVKSALLTRKELLDELHFRKIDISDGIFVVNVGGYIGESTRREIDYALLTGKPVSYLEPINAAT